MKTERELFELWCIKDDEFCIHRYTEKCEDYSEWDTQAAWRAWQASASREGYKLVPLNPTPKMIDSTWDHDDEIIEMSSNTRNEFIYKAMIGAVE